jgi:hypothetical protein
MMRTTTMDEWGLFNDDSADWSAEESVEAEFYSEADAIRAKLTRYSPEDNLIAHLIEEPEEEDSEE